MRLARTARWALTLEPGQGWSLETFAFIPPDDSRLRWRSLELEGLHASAQAERESWQDRKAPLDLEMADQDLQTLIQALAHHLSTFDQGRHFAPGAFFYNHAWIRDSAFLAIAHDLWGLHEAVSSKEKAWMRLQTFYGDFRSHSGEWDGSGQTLFLWATHILMSGHEDLLTRHWKKFARAARWIVKTRTSQPQAPLSRSGLLPAGLSAEHFGPNDHYLWDNFWSLAGMERLHLLLSRWDKAPGGVQALMAWLKAEIESYQSDLQGHIERLTAKNGGLLPSSPYRHPDAACIGTLVALSPLDLELAFYPAPWLRANADYLLEHWVFHQLFFQPIIHTGGNAYLTAQLARALQCLGDKRWLDLLEGILAHASPTWTWPEAIHPRTGGGCMGDGDHGWACAEVLSLVRLALVREQAGTILLLPNAPLSWWADGTLSLAEAPTSAGSVTFSLRPDGQQRYLLTWELHRSPLQAPWPLIFVVPEGFELESPLPSCQSPWGTDAVALPDQGQACLLKSRGRN